VNVYGIVDETEQFRLLVFQRELESENEGISTRSLHINFSLKLNYIMLVMDETQNNIRIRKYANCIIDLYFC
jgi:hypothetical protein